MSFLDLFANFFVHKDFLPAASEIPGTLFTPLHFIFAGIVIGLIALFTCLLVRCNEKTMKVIMTVVWASIVVLETAKIFWEIYAGREVSFFAQGVLPLYPCSLFMFIYPLALWGHGLVKHAAGAYVCTLGTLGALINFVYPVNVISTYSCISFAGTLTFYNHGFMLLAALVLLIRGEHSFRGIDSLSKLLVVNVPVLLFSIPVNIVNFTIDADYMFFKCNSFILAPIGAATPDIVSVLMMYAFYIILHTAPYLPSYISNRIKQNKPLMA